MAAKEQSVLGVHCCSESKIQTFSACGTNTAVQQLILSREWSCNLPPGQYADYNGMAHKGVKLLKPDLPGKL